MPRFVCLVALLLLGAPLSAQPKGGPLPPDDALKALKVADGFQVELFAAEPMLINPTSIDVDHKGRVWVAEAVNYRRKNFGRPIIRKEGDRIQVLVDEKGEGKASKAVTFYQGEELYGPLGVCVLPYPDGKGQKVFVCQSPDILAFEDKDGDLKADGPPKKFLTGFGGFDHDHGVHGINIGPDGKLYFTVGDSGVTGLQSADGKGKKWVSNTTDVQKGTVWRCDTDGTNLELIAHNFRNNYEACVDSFGEVWLSDNDDDGNQQTRICFVMPGGNYGYGPRGPGQSHWHEEQPGIVHKTLRTGFGSPTGITFYEGDLFDKKYRGSLLHCDAGPREVRWFHRKPKGAGYELEKEILLTSSDNWFRPSDVCVAPDGSIIVADWYDRGVGGHGMGDPTDGRIYRIAPKGHKGYRVPEVKPSDLKWYVGALKSPCAAVRYMAFAKIRPLVLQVTDHIKEWVEAKGAIKSDDKIKEVWKKLEAIEKELQEANVWDGPPENSARALWLICVSNRGDWNDTPMYRALASGVLFTDDKRKSGPLPLTLLRIDRSLGDNEFYRAARTMYPLETSPKTDLPKDSIDALNRDPNKFVELYGPTAAAQRELLLSMPGIGLEYVKPVFYALAKKYDGSDHFYRAALNIACGTDPARRDAILADFDKHFPEWNDKVADLVWELRPKSVLPRLGKLLSDGKLTAVQKSRIVDIIASNDDPSAGQAMLAVLKSDAASEVKGRAVESLKLFLPTKWKALQGSKELTQQVGELLKEPKSRVTGLQLVAAIGSADYVGAVANIAKDKDAPLDLRKEAVRALGKIKDDKSVSALIDVGSPENPLSVACVQALGDLLPSGPKSPKYATVALDSLVRAINAGDRGTPELKSAALSALAGNRAGTQWLLDTHQKSALPKELVAQAGQLLRNSPFQGERNRALLLFPAPGKLNPKSLPAVAELARRQGDVARGKAVWNASLTGTAQCAKCHMVRGVGGQIGPDLSMIGKKASRENLYESLLTPSKAIADQYIPHSVTTTADVVVSGLLVGDSTDAITLRDANGKDTTIAKKDIDGAVRKLKNSLMPDDIVAALNEDELVDLVAYLETLKTAALTPDSFAVAGPFPAESMNKALDTAFGPETGAFDPKSTWTMKGVTVVGWKTLRPDGKGYFDLAGTHGSAGANSASYMYVEVDSPAEQGAEVLLGPDDGAKLWLNGKEVFTSRETKAASPEAQKVAVKLVKGKNAVLLKVANGNNPHGFYFSLTSAEEVKVVPRK